MESIDEHNGLLFWDYIAGHRCQPIKNRYRYFQYSLNLYFSIIDLLPQSFKNNSTTLGA
jgi:hypothetical protein